MRYLRNAGYGTIEAADGQTAVDLFEEQVEQYLSQITLPPDYQQRIIDAYDKEDKDGPGFEQQHQILNNLTASTGLKKGTSGEK